MERAITRQEFAAAEDAAKRGLSVIHRTDFIIANAMDLDIQHLLNGLNKETRERLPESIYVKDVLSPNGRSKKTALAENRMGTHQIKFNLKTFDVIEALHATSILRDNDGWVDLPKDEQIEIDQGTKFSEREKVELWPEIVAGIEKAVNELSSSPTPQKI